MNLSGLLSALRALPEYQAAQQALAQSSGPRLALNLPRAGRAPAAAALAQDLARPVLVLAPRIDRALALAEELSVWNPASRVLLFSEPNPLFYEYEAWGPRTIRSRITVLTALASHPSPVNSPQSRAADRTSLVISQSSFIVVASARALMTRTLPLDDFRANTHALTSGQPLRLEKMLEAWIGAGYTSETVAVEPGQFARRGGIIDIFPMADDQPVRLELFGDEVESLRRFDPATQRSGAAVDSVTITPAREALPRHARDDIGMSRDEEQAAANPLPPASYLEFQLPLMFPPASVLDYLPSEALVLVDDWRELADTVSEFEEQAVQLRGEQVDAGIIPGDFPLPYHTWDELQDQLAERNLVFLAAPEWEAEALPATVNLGARFHPGPRYGGQLKPLLAHLHDLRTSRQRAVVVTRQAHRLAELWGEQYPYLAPTESLDRLPAEGALSFIQGAIAEGWILDAPSGGGRPAAEAAHPPAATVHLLTDSEIFGWARPEVRRRQARPVAAAPEAGYSDFAPGDYIVHADFGIGRFRELARRAIDQFDREYLWLEYADGDELYVPVHQADRLTKYIGPDEHPPVLSRLGSADWQTAKTQTREAVETVARDLLELYAKREAVQGRAFGPDTPWQAELEASFPYVETEDQLRAIREVKTDMERARPMDRLICGDVGYGKTEVALRAAFKAVMEGTQVVVLVPTTILAQQHLHTFQARLVPYPVKVEMLSRFRSRAEAEAILAQLAAGALDIVIGTHRLLQKDVHFKNLSLLIIDEEQRFGVTHKEQLKQMRTEVDVLTLTATPIPRTLYLSLTGVRDISTINTPPEERLPIITHSGPYNERVARQAILRELDRGGQVFFVHNRVQSIGVVRQKLERLIPQARLGVGHGQMDEHELSQVMDQFANGEIDILLCTSIIESGLDIPNANTLIVDRADTFGLAQLYQLRGRVGRGAARAYAYFFTDTRHRPTAEAHERLETIAEQTELGAGYSIAMRDLEMRGAGDILGRRQSGQIAAVGFHLYTRLLSEAVKRLRSEGRGPQPAASDFETRTSHLGLTTVDLPLPASLPSDYIADRRLRLQLYRRLADLTDESEVEAVGSELADRFGPLPRAVEDLIYQLKVKVRAGRAGVEAVSSDSGQIVITLPAAGKGDGRGLSGALPANLGPGVRVSKNRLWLARAASEGDWRAQLLEVLAKLGEAQTA